MRVRRGLAAGCAWVVLNAAVGAQAAPAGGAHPALDDRGTLRWHVSYVDAQQAATAERRAVLVVAGTADDAATRDLVTQILPDARVAKRLSALVVGLASDPAREDPGVRNIVKRNLPDGGLPAVGFVTAEGRWITGYRGATDVSAFLAHVARAEAALGRAATPAPVVDERSLPPPQVRPARPDGEAPPAVPVPGLPDTRAERERLPETLNGSPDEPALSAPPPPPPTASVGEPARERRDGAGTPAGARGDGRCSSVLVRARGDVGAARQAAEAGRWGEVLALARGSDDLRLIVLERRARAWAQAELDRCLAEALAGRTDAALEGLKAVRAQMGEEPAGVDAARGYEAVADWQSLQQLAEPQGVFAQTLRRNRYDQLRGTRWARLFQSPS